ncbi:MAG: Hpt domain-containing protein [Alphaproteobacteria bacterium]|nr:Hpt domain-containing protein [Alphaproteobacteria bacterium]
MASLRAAFLTELNGQRPVLTAGLMKADTLSAAAPERALLIAATHSLSGRGGTFGFPELSEKAAALNALLEAQSRDVNALRQAARALMTAMARILDPPPRG